jgi:putative membrane protein
VKYLLIFLLVLAIFVISVTLGAQNDQQVTFNYLLAQGEYRVSTCLRSYLLQGLHWLAGLRPVLAESSCFSARERKIKRLETNLRLRPTLRNLPVAGSEGIIEYAGVVVSAFACSRSLWLVYGPQKCATNKAG